VTTRIETLNSVYEVDEENKRVRRVSGANEPTTFQAADGEWQEYSHKTDFCSALAFEWPHGGFTVTSPVIYAEEV
jgi:hypothetical protein